MTDGIKELIPELKRIGNNLNQIAKRCNEGPMNLLIMTTPLKIRQLRRWCASPCVIFWICSHRRIMS